MVTSEDSENASVPLDVLCCVEFNFCFVSIVYTFIE